MDIAFVGAGHVGLVSGASLAAVGHRVRVFDIDVSRIARIRAGETPFREPGLDELLELGRRTGRLTFHVEPEEAIADAALVFVCVSTPNDAEGRVDLTGVISATATIARHASRGSVLVNRSTSPVGTAEYIRSILEEKRDGDISVAVNPEFLAEGTAIRNFLAPDRLVLGAWEGETVARLLEAYDPIVRRRIPPEVPDAVGGGLSTDGQPVPVVVSAPPTAELTKYAANAFLAVKISFINEIAQISEELGADVCEVARAVGLDPRIGPHFLGAGIGWGGSCFPKDIVALQGMAETHGLQARMLRAANDVNTDQRRWVARHLQRQFRTLSGRRVGLLGLSFKADTDDLRNAPALEIAAELARMNVKVSAYDPWIRSLPEPFDALLELVDGPEELARGADALVLVTEWKEFASLNLAGLRGLMRSPVLLDGRNFFDPAAARAAGLLYVGVGRPSPPAVPLPEHRRPSKTGAAAKLVPADRKVPSGARAAGV